MWLAAMVFLWPHNHAGGMTLINLWFTAFTPLWFLKAAFLTWGSYAVSGSADGVTVFSGIGTVGYSRHFGLASLYQIRLRTQYGRHGRTRKKIVIDADRHFAFGEELSDAQRQFLAVRLLLKKRKELLRQAAVKRG